MDHVVDVIFIGLAAIIMVVSLSSFMSTQTQIDKFLSHDTEHYSYYRTNNDDTAYQEISLGHEIIVQIVSDDKSINYIVNDSFGTELVNVTDCSDVTVLSSINKTGLYDIQKNYINGLITTIIYKARW